MFHINLFIISNLIINILIRLCIKKNVSIQNAKIVVSNLKIHNIVVLNK